MSTRLVHRKIDRLASCITGLLSCLLLACGSAQAANCRKAVTTPDLNHCAKQEQQAVEAKLNQAYQQAMAGFNEPDTEFEKFSDMKQKLMEAQRAWVKFRELDCDAVHAFYAQGSIRTVMFLGCMRQHAEQRIKDLNGTYGPK